MKVGITQGSHRDNSDFMRTLQVLKRYKGFVMTVALLVMFGVALYDFFLPNIYQAETTIAIKSDRKEGTESDFIAKALDMGISNIDDEIGLMKSRWIVSKALENLNIQTRYFTKELFKMIELYKDAPFIVTYKFTTPRIKGAFTLIPIDENQYRLILEPTLLNKLREFVRSLISSVPAEKQALYYDQIHHYSEVVVTPWFSLNVQKMHEPSNTVYQFYKMSDEQTYQFVLKHLFINKWSEFSKILSLKFKDTIALRSKEVLDALSQAYLQEDLNLKTASADKTLNFLDTQLEAINKTVQNSAQNLQKYKATNIIVDLKSKAASTTQKISELEKERYALNMQQNVLENLLTYIKNDHDLSKVSYGFSISVSEPINNLILKIQEAVSRRNSLLVDYTELHPDVLKETQRIITLRGSLEKSLQSNIQSIKSRKRTLWSLIQKHENALESLPGKERTLAQLNRNFMVNEKIYAFLLQKRAETAIIQTSTVSEARIVDGAVVPQEAIAPRRFLGIIFGFIFGLLLGVILALVRNYFDDTIKSKHDIEPYSDIPLYGVIPLLDTEKKLQPFLEALRVVRTNLDFLKAKRVSKLVLVTSSVPSEGKSTVISELGKIIAQGQRKVLVMDLDMRRSSLQLKFNLDNSKGVSSLLAGHEHLESVIQKTEFDNLDVITAGPIPPNPSELLMSKEFEFMIENLLKKYDYLLLDTPPIEVVTDSTMLAKISDINLFVFRVGYSKKEFVKEINNFVTLHQLKNSGIILNGVHLEQRHSYGYKYGYYHDKR